MRNRISQRLVYFTCIIAFLLLLSILLFLYPNGRSFFIINGMNISVLDSAFSYITHLGDGITSIIICVLLIVFYNLGSGIVASLGLSICGTISYVMKYHWFAYSQRPYHFFWNNKFVHYVDGIIINKENSFPSGHSLTAFFIFTFIAMLSIAKPTFIQLLLALVAILAAYSRVYLAQHFVGDIFTGAIMGIIFGLIFHKIYAKTKTIRFLNTSLIGFIKK